MKSHKGFTLIELAVVLAIIAVLAAVLTPIVTNYVDQARLARAMADTKTIADAFNLYKRDTNYWPIWANLAAAAAGTSPAVQALVSPGTVPAAGAGSGWGTFSSTGLLTDYVNANNLNLTTTNNSPGKIGFRGPYIGGVDSDPWGNAYVVATVYLKNASIGIDRGYVVCAGPNGILEMKPAQGVTTFSTNNSSGAATDDIAVPIN